MAIGGGVVWSCAVHQGRVAGSGEEGGTRVAASFL